MGHWACTVKTHSVLLNDVQLNIVILQFKFTYNFRPNRKISLIFYTYFMGPKSGWNGAISLSNTFNISEMFIISKFFSSESRKELVGKTYLDYLFLVQSPIMWLEPSQPEWSNILGLCKIHWPNTGAATFRNCNSPSILTFRTADYTTLSRFTLAERCLGASMGQNLKSIRK